MTKKFIDDAIDHKEDDIEKIQTKPNMYVSYTGSKGALHLSREMINNMIDECVNPNSPGDEINIYVDETSNTTKVSDNGRGIPFDKMEVACTKLQAGSKFTRATGGGSAGENGVGMTATNALSETFEIISKRYGEKATIRFTNGKLTGPMTVEPTDKNIHGTTVIFKPSEYYLGEDCNIPSSELIEWVEQISYLLPTSKSINISVTPKGKDSAIVKKFKNKNGLGDYVKKLYKKAVIQPIHLMRSMKIPEVINNPDYTVGGDAPKHLEVERFMGLEFAFTFDTTITDMISHSFCNYVYNIDGGEHENAVKTAICQYLTTQTKDTFTEKETKSGLDVQFKDITNSLVMSLYVSSDMQPEFSGQTKEKLTSRAYFKPLRSMAYNALVEYFKLNPKDLKRCTDVIKANAKARLASGKTRENAIKTGGLDNFSERSLKNFMPANNNSKNGYRELFIIEGESAAGSGKSQRYDNDSQAMFSMRGVPLNTFNKTAEEALANEEFRVLVEVLRCGIGSRFNIDQLWYKKIIIMTDSDVDGSKITSLLCVFLIRHMPELVEKGFVYKALAPLYRIQNRKGEREFIRDKHEFIDVFEARIGDSIRLSHPETGTVLKKKEMKEFLLINRFYLEELVRIADRFSIHKDIIEFIAIHHGSPKFEKKLLNTFPEMEIEDDALSGVYEGRFQILTMDKLFFKRIDNLVRLIHNPEMNGGQTHYQLSEKTSQGYMDRGVMSLGQIMELTHKFRPKILTRYKGLGELNPKQLEETTLDPNNRILIKLTIEDLEAELNKFRILHGPHSTCGEERKELMRNFKIEREDLDN